MSSGPVLTLEGLTMRTTGMLDSPTTRALAHEIEVQFFVERGVDRLRHVAKRCVEVGGCTHNRFGRDIGASASVHQRRGRAPKTPILLDVLGVRGRLKLQNHERALPRMLEVTASPVSLGVAATPNDTGDAVTSSIRGRARS